MEDEELRRAVKRKTRLRLSFAVVTLALYFSYLLNYLPGGDFLSDRLGSSWVTGSLAMFASLIVIFIALELVFLFVDSDDDPDARGS